MSRLAPPTPRASRARHSYVLVASKYNSEYVDGLVSHCTEELHHLAPAAKVTLHRVPGAFEIPIIVRELALQEAANAIIALGVILHGKTTHAEHLAEVVTRSLQELALTHGCPVIHAVLALQNKTQARERCLGNRINRGTEAARAAFEVANLLAELRK